MTAPDSRDSVERVVAEMREELSYSVHAVEVSVSAFRAWVDRLQSLARGPQQAGGEDVARQFHEAYERLAPQFGYETRPETRLFNPTTSNGQLMIAVCNEVVGGLQEEVARLREARELLLQVKHFGGTKAGAIDVFLTRTDKGPKDG